MTDKPISAAYPLSWLFHANTMRWAHNAEPPPEDAWPMDPRETPDLPLIGFPSSPAPIELEDLLQRRCSCRAFGEAPVTLSAIGAVLRDGYGIIATDRDKRLEFPLRPVPSGGSLYPLELTLIARHIEGLAPGIYHYVAEHHGMEKVAEASIPKVLLDYLFMGQASLTAAPAILVLSAVWERTMTKYGDRGYRYMLLEAGHVMQNINLSAAGRGLGSCNIGGFFDVELGDLLQLDRDSETPLYACAIGVSTTEDRMAQRDIG
jgi:SagB-type dehydrogenase family enzyme